MLTQQILLDENVQPWWFFASISNCNLQGGGKHEIGDGLICRKFEPQKELLLVTKSFTYGIQCVTQVASKMHFEKLSKTFLRQTTCHRKAQKFTICWKNPSKS